MSNENIDNQEGIESLKKKIADILALMNRGGITRKAVEEMLKSEEIMSLQARGDDLRKQADELSRTIVPTEVFEARGREFDEKAEKALREGDIDKARKIQAEKNQFLQEREKTIRSGQALNAQTEGVEGQIRVLLRPVFFECMSAIKLELARQLALVLAFKNTELSEFVTLQQEHQIQLPFNPTNEIRIFPDSPFRKLREMLSDELLP